MSINSTGWFKMLFVFVVSAILVGAGLVVSAQDETTRGSSMTQNTSTSNMGTRRSSRRSSRRRASANANTGDMSGMSNENTGGAMQENTNMGSTMTGNTGTGRRGRRGRRGRASGMANANAGMATTTGGGEQTDLSGTYTGTFNCADAGLTGDGTLTINGTSFTASSGSANQTGRITAVTTRGYTGVAMQFGEATAPAPGQTATPPTIVSVRAKRAGDRLTLTSVPGAMRQCSFTPSGGGMGRRSRRGRRGGTMNNMGTTNSNMGMTGGNANTGDMSGNTNTGGRRSRRGSRRGGNTNSNMGTMNSNMTP